MDVHGNWRLYTNTIPVASTPLGTVTRDGDTGALVRIEATGAYAQVNAGVIRTLDGRKTRFLIEKGNKNVLQQKFSSRRRSGGNIRDQQSRGARYDCAP